MSFIVRRKITGRPCGQVVGDEVISSLSISHCIFSGVNFILILTAALQARLAAISSLRLDLAAPFRGKPEVIFSTRGDVGSIAQAGERQGVMEVPPEFGQILSYERESSSAENR